MNKILFIDDDLDYQRIIVELLTLEGYKVTAVNNPIDAIEVFKNNHFNLVISDLMMDKMDGLQLYSILKRIDIKVPVIILTGNTSERKEIEGLQENIYDYIYKPISMEVLLTRIERAINKDGTKLVELISDVDEIRVNLEQRKAYKNGVYIPLTGKEYKLLVFLLSNKGKIFSRDELLEKVWHVDCILVDTRTVDTHIKNLRAKLKLNSISSVRGIGYEWYE